MDNTIRCWGSNQYGQRADQLTSEFTAVSAGYYHNCAIRTNGDVLCWGLGDNGQIAAPPGPFTAVSAGFTHTCGLRPSGNIECWGEDKAGETKAPPTDRFVAVSAEQFHSCGILESGAVRCWGSDEHGRATPPEGKFVSVDAGELHTCATRDDGSVICWGDDSLGQRDVAAAVIGDHEAPPDDPTPEVVVPKPRGGESNTDGVDKTGDAGGEMGTLAEDDDGMEPVDDGDEGEMKDGGMEPVGGGTTDGEESEDEVDSTGQGGMETVDAQ